MPENLDHYSRTDYRRAERKFLKHALVHLRIETKLNDEEG
jgi:hypothetical protein